MGQSKYADVSLRTSDHEVIHVHRVILSARSSYFQELFSNERTAATTTLVVCLDVPETYVTMMHILRYLYTGDLSPYVTQHPRESDDDVELLMDDIKCAYRLNLRRLMRVCEHALNVTRANCLDVLHSCDQDQVPMMSMLRERALSSVVEHLESQSHEAKFSQLLSSIPELRHEILDRVRRHQSRTGARMMLQEWTEKAIEAHRVKQEQSQEEHQMFPWRETLGLGVLALVYLGANQQFEALVVWTPVINGLLLVMVALVMVYTLSNQKS